MTLYGDPADDDTLDGRTLIVSTSSGSAAIGGPRIGSDPERIDVGNRRGVLVHDGDRTWFAFDTDMQDYVEFVGARGLADDEVLAAAAGAVFAERSESIVAEALPSDLRPLSSRARIDCGELISLPTGAAPSGSTSCVPNLGWRRCGAGGFGIAPVRPSADGPVPRAPCTGPPSETRRGSGRRTGW